MEGRKQQMRWCAGVLLAMAGMMVGTMATAWGQQAAQGSEPASYGVVVTSLGGDAEYEKLIQGWGKDLAAALRKGRNAEGHIYWLAAVKEEGVHAVSTKEEIGKLFEQLSRQVRAGDTFGLYLVGHGSYDDHDYKLSIPGPDLTGQEWAALLNKIPAERQAVVNMTSASGASLAAFQRKGRVIITSTTAGRERNFSVFGRYFVAALQDEAADADKNQAISALEAYRYATREVTRYYESAKRIATEHPVLEDKGEGEGEREPSPENGQGLLASAFPLVRFGTGDTVAGSPEVRELRAAKRRLEESIEALKYRKAGMDTEEYAMELEKLLLELSRSQIQLDDLEKGSE
jgi:hypothetical protein